jgi:hypothetical protein
MPTFVSYDRFVNTFREVAGGVEEQLLEQWLEQKKYTDTFLLPGTGVLPRIAARLGLEYQREVGRVDAIFYAPVDGNKSVSVAVEHEHIAATTSQEMWSLSLLNVPLKVLITYPNEGDERRLLDSYLQVFRAADIFNDFCDLRRQLVIFGCADDSVTWRFYVYSGTGFTPFEVRK